jgi:hypothetical protein
VCVAPVLFCLSPLSRQCHQETEARLAAFPLQVFNVEKIDAPAGDAMLHIKVRGWAHRFEGRRHRQGAH